MGSNMSSRIVAGLSALMVVMATGVAQATVLFSGGGWSAFNFGGVGVPFADTFTFTLTAPATFNITDAFADGDQFDVIINGVDKGATSTPLSDGTGIGADYDAAFASPKFSHASYTLGPGDYTVTGSPLLSPFGDGGAAVELVASAGGVPEPAAWAMMLIGLCSVGGAIRARRGALLAAV